MLRLELEQKPWNSAVLGLGLWSWSSEARRLWDSEALHCCETFLALRLCILVRRSSTPRLELGLWSFEALALELWRAKVLGL